MQTAKRRFEPGVIERLLRQPQRFEFVQAVRVLQQWLAQNGVPPERALAHLLRFQNSVSLGFPPSQIEALALDAGDAVDGAAALLPALLAALRGGGQARIRITPAFMGLLGVGGALPLHYTERVRASAQSHDDGARAFFDTFSTRMPALYYQGWGKYRLEHRLDVEGRDAWLPLLLALGGASAASFGRRADGRDSGVDADVGGYYAGLIRHRPVSACALGRALSDYFGVPVALEQFVGAWDAIPANRVCRLGGGNAMLGHAAALGERIWREDVRVRLRVGPLDKAGLERFLPGSAGARALEKMLATFDLGALQCEVLLLTRAAGVEPAALAGARQPRGPRLGWDAYLVNGPQTADRAEVRYLLRPS